LIITALASAAALLAGDGDWQVVCRPGEDEYASNCDAELRTPALRVTLATADSQVFLTVEATACPAEGRSIDRNWWRTDLTILTPARRDARLRREIARAVAALRRRCPGLQAGPLQLGTLPDIIEHGDP
jgi:hypothetical protein